MTTSGTGTITLSNVIYSNPQFLQTSNWLSNDYLDVSNVAYGIAAAGQPLGGGAHYFGVTPVVDFASIGANRGFSISGGIGPYSSWTSDNNAVASVSSTANNTATVNAVSAGVALITVKDSLSRTAAAATLNVTATSSPLVPEPNNAVLRTREIQLP